MKRLSLFFILCFIIGNCTIFAQSPADPCSDDNKDNTGDTSNPDQGNTSGAHGSDKSPANRWWHWLMTYPPLVLSGEPNDIRCLGVGAENWKGKYEDWEFIIRSENIDTATNAARNVRILYTIPPQFDLNTLYFDRMVWDSLKNGVRKHQLRLAIPPQTTYKKGFYRLDQDRSMVYEFKLDPFNRLLEINLHTVVAGTENEDSYLFVEYNQGFMQINDTVTHKGEAEFYFTIRPAEHAKHGDTVESVVSIQFDNEAPVISEKWTNRIDALPPVSRIEMADTLKINTLHQAYVRWSSTDQGAGIVPRYLLYYKKHEDDLPKLLGEFQDQNQFLFSVGGDQEAYYFAVVTVSDSVGNEELLDNSRFKKVVYALSAQAKAPKFSVGKDTTVCYKKPLRFDLSALPQDYQVDWFGKVSKRVLDTLFTENTLVWAKVTDPKTRLSSSDTVQVQITKPQTAAAQVRHYTLGTNPILSFQSVTTSTARWEEMRFDSTQIQVSYSNDSLRIKPLFCTVSASVWLKVLDSCRFVDYEIKLQISPQTQDSLPPAVQYSTRICANSLIVYKTSESVVWSNDRDSIMAIGTNYQQIAHADTNRIWVQKIQFLGKDTCFLGKKRLETVIFPKPVPFINRFHHTACGDQPLTFSTITEIYKSTDFTSADLVYRGKSFFPENLPLFTDGQYFAIQRNTYGCFEGHSTIAFRKEIPPVVLKIYTNLDLSRPLCIGDYFYLNVGLSQGGEQHEILMPNKKRFLAHEAVKITAEHAGEWRIRLSSSRNCVGRDTTFILNVHQPLPMPVVVAGKPLCENDSVRLYASNKPPQAITFFEFPDGTIVQTDTLIGKAQLGYKVWFQLDKCLSEKNTIPVNPYPVASIISNHREGYLCHDELLFLETNAIATDIRWFLGDSLIGTGSKIVLAKPQTGLYRLIANNQGCISKNEQFISVLPSFHAQLIQKGDSLIVEGNADRYEWYKDNQLINHQEKSYLPTQNGVYRVKGYYHDCEKYSNFIFVNHLREIGEAVFKEEKQSCMRMYPNPTDLQTTSTKLLIECDTIAGEIYLSIYDAINKMLIAKDIVLHKSSMQPTTYEYILPKKGVFIFDIDFFITTEKKRIKHLFKILVK